MSKLDKRRKGVYGPPLGKKFIIFVDDINLPAMDPVGSKGAIELLRQMMDHKIWYDNKELFSMKIVDTGVIAAIRPPQGDNDKMCGRFMRHFNTIYIDHFDDTTVSAIFSRIVLWHLDTKGFSKEFDPCIEQAKQIFTFQMNQMQRYESIFHRELKTKLESFLVLRWLRQKLIQLYACCPPYCHDIQSLNFRWSAPL